MKPTYSTKDWLLYWHPSGTTHTAVPCAGYAADYRSPSYDQLSWPSEKPDPHVGMHGEDLHRSGLMNSETNIHVA